ncbi:MAG TPA: MerR family transcriptional regulator [Labilithrix sp.]|jgi:DNA-binding transcriptional MerR regulator|nr:MerR family transcriptional regulator [Labilithrix sp.]
MKEHSESRRAWRVGELAKATGLTVRTLHHYEHIGLLSPRSRTKARHRLYDANDVRRLYQVRALRDIGMPLTEIRRVLRDKPSLEGVLRAHALRVEDEVSRLKRLQALLRQACRHASSVSPDDLLATIEAMATVSRRAEVLQKRPRRNEAARWRKLGAELRSCMRRRAPASSSRVLDLARKAKTYIDEFAGGDSATVDALALLRRAAPVASPKTLAGWTPALMKYLDLALTELAKEQPAC